FGLVRQIGSPAIDQINAWQTIFARDLLGAQMLFNGHWKIRAALDGGIVADDNAFTSLNPAYSGDQARTVDCIIIHAIGGERRKLQEWRTWINQVHDAIARQQLATTHMALARALGSAQARFGTTRPQFRHEAPHAFRIGAKFGGVVVN